jgi:hypothetical protein
MCVCERAEDKNGGVFRGRPGPRNSMATDGWIRNTYIYIYNAYINICNVQKYIFRNSSALFSTVQTNHRTITVSPHTPQTRSPLGNPPLEIAIQKKRFVINSVSSHTHTHTHSHTLTHTHTHSHKHTHTHG